MKKTTVWILVLLCIISMLGISVSAAPTESFNRIDGEGNSSSSILARESFVATRQITASSLGTEKPLKGLLDVFVAEDGYIYLLCNEVSRIIVLNSDYTLYKEMSFTDPNGDEVDFSGAQGVYVGKDGNIYIADTISSRILVSDKMGQIIDILEAPVSELIPKGFIYHPVRILIDNDNFMYVLSEGCYYGALVFTPEREFAGFMGSNTVTTSALTALGNIWDMLTGTDAKKAASTKKLPYSFVDFTLDTSDYIVTCTGSTEYSSNGTGQIRKINSSGANILYKTNAEGGASESGSFNFLEKKVLMKPDKALYDVQNIASIDLDKDGFIYALDRTYGLVYVFDNECNFITGFGGGRGQGTQVGVFTLPESIAVYNGSVLVVDSATRSLTVFERTGFGSKMFHAQSLYLNGDYNGAGSLFKEILKEDSGNQLAYRGLAMYSYINKDYDAAMSYAKKGFDYSVYDMAHEKKLSDTIANNFFWILLAFALVVAFVFVVILKIKNKKSLSASNPKLSAYLNVCIHPFNSFNDITYKNQGSVLLAVVTTFAFYLVTVLKETASGFPFLTKSPKNYNTLYSLAQTIGLVVLWSVINFLICSLFDGKGSFKKVFILTAYSLIPIVIYTAVYVVLSHILPYSGSAFLDGLYTVTLIFTFFLLAVAMMTVHEINFFKFLLTSVVSVFAMLFAIFILFMVVILVQQFGNMLYAIFIELLYR